MKLKIGLILPGSYILPSMSKDFKKGFELAINEKNLPNINIQSEFVNQGGKADVQKASEKLIQHNDVDVLVGIISTVVSQHLKDFYQSMKIPILLNNLGEDIFLKSDMSDFYFLNGMHLWKSQWALGNWAQTQFGGDTSLCMTIYDAGYHLHEAYRLGSAAAGGEKAHYNVLKIQPGIVNTQSLIESILLQKPKHVHAILCGKDAEDFWMQYHKAGLLGKIPLTVSPFFFSTFEGNETNTGNVFSASSWTDIANKENELFLDAYEKEYELPTSSFSFMGYETGLLLAEAIIQSKTKKELAAQLKKATVNGPRGEVSYDFSVSANDSKIWLKELEIQETGEQIIKSSEVIKGPEYENAALQRIPQGAVSGWQNPYLCI